METKAGFKTTEFWLTLFSQLIGLAALIVGATGNDHWIAIVGMVQAGMAQMSYSSSRGQVKSAPAPGIAIEPGELVAGTGVIATQEATK